MSNRFRGEDNGKTEEEIEGIIAAREARDGVRKIIGGTIGILLSCLAFFLVMWINKVDNNMDKIVENSKSYTDNVMFQHKEDIDPMVKDFLRLRETIVDLRIQSNTLALAVKQLQEELKEFKQDQRRKSRLDR